MFNDTNISCGGYLLKNAKEYTITKTARAYKLSYQAKGEPKETLGYPRTQRVARNAIRHHQVYGTYSTAGRE